MLPGRGILGALLRSRRDYGSEPPRNCTGNDEMHRERKGPRTGDEAAAGDDDGDNDASGRGKASGSDAATVTPAMMTPAMATKSALAGSGAFPARTAANRRPIPS